MTETMTDTAVCISCDEPVNTDGTDDVYWANLAEGWQCWPCRESEEQYGATIVHLMPGAEPVRILWTEAFAFDMGYGEDVDLHEEYPGLAQKWHSTDGWRGYTDVTIPDGWEPVEDGEGSALWGTRTRTSDLAQSLIEQGDEVDREYLIVTAPTSNVFALTIDIFVREEADE